MNTLIGSSRLPNGKSSPPSPRATIPSLAGCGRTFGNHRRGCTGLSSGWKLGVFGYASNGNLETTNERTRKPFDVERRPHTMANG
jgi:hypothetical protein